MEIQGNFQSVFKWQIPFIMLRRTWREFVQEKNEGWIWENCSIRVHFLWGAVVPRKEPSRGLEREEPHPHPQLRVCIFLRALRRPCADPAPASFWKTPQSSHGWMCGEGLRTVSDAAAGSLRLTPPSQESVWASQAQVWPWQPPQAPVQPDEDYWPPAEGEGKATAPPKDQEAAWALLGQGRRPQPLFFLLQQAHESLLIVVQRCSLSSLLYMTRGTAETTLRLKTSWKRKQPRTVFVSILRCVATSEKGHKTVKLDDIASLTLICTAITWRSVKMQVGGTASHSAFPVLLLAKIETINIRENLTLSPPSPRNRISPPPPRARSPSIHSQLLSKLTILITGVITTLLFFILWAYMCVLKQHSLCLPMFEIYTKKNNNMRAPL